MGGAAVQLLHSPSLYYRQEYNVVDNCKYQGGRVKGGASRGCHLSKRVELAGKIRIRDRIAELNSTLYLISSPARLTGLRSTLNGCRERAVGNGRVLCASDDISSDLSAEVYVELTSETVYDQSGGVNVDNSKKIYLASEDIETTRDYDAGSEKVLASAIAAAVIVSKNADTFNSQAVDLDELNKVEGHESFLLDELPDGVEGPDAAASLLGTKDHQKSLWEQMREIVIFAGPALGIWLSGPIMSIIDTAVVGQSSAVELAALGPGTVFCDQLCYVFMFLSISTSNLIATALAHKDKDEAAGHLSRLLFISLFCGLVMMVAIECFTTQLLTAFVGAKNAAIIPAAQSYVQIRALAWPIVLVGMVSQSASLGMKDSWAPLKVLAIASAVNLFGDIALCSFFKYGIAGAAWATMASQYIAGILMLKSLGDKGYNPFAVTIPSWSELMHIWNLAAPILLTMISKVAFYTVITYLATSLGAMTLAAHQVMVGVFSLCTVWGEPLAQTAQSFMPSLITGSNRDLKQARSLLRTLIVIGALVGVSLGSFAISVPWFFPQIFTREPAIISQMRAVTVPFFLSLMITPPILSCEGTLLAGRDLKFLGFSMVSCFAGGTLLLLLFNKIGVGLRGSWWTLVAFQSARFIQSYTRLAGPRSILNDEMERGTSIHLKTT